MTNMTTHEEAPGAVGAATEGQIPEGTNLMDMMAETPAEHEGWVDVRTMPFGMLMTSTVAQKLAEAVVAGGGPLMYATVEIPGIRGRRPMLHPTLAEKVRQWCDELPRTLGRYVPMSLAPTAAPVAPAPAPEAHAQSGESDGLGPCARFPWCDGHRDVEDVDDRAAHFGRVVHLEGTHGEVEVRFYLQESSPLFPVPEAPSFAITAWDEWTLPAATVEAGMDEYLRLIGEARDGIRAFVAARQGESS